MFVYPIVLTLFSLRIIYPSIVSQKFNTSPGSPDERYIRVETCMFMIKLPQYSSQEVMTQRLMYAIHCREDPLSG